MERNIISIVAEQLKAAQDKHAHALQVVERMERMLNRKNVLLAKAGDILINIEEIHDLLVE